MAKKRAICPECGHGFTAHFQGIHGQVAGVRFKRTTGNQFNQTINVPGEMIENDRYYSIAEQMIACGGVGICAGATFGLLISPLFVPYDALCVLISTGTGATASLAILASERAWQLLRALPAAVNQYLILEKVNLPETNNIELTMDHRYRDGHTEVGRTIQYFGTLPVDVKRFNEWATAVLGSENMPAVPLAHSEWYPLENGKTFSRTEYEKLLRHMRQCETVINVPGKGHKLTGGGRRALHRHLKAHPPTPSRSMHDG